MRARQYPIRMARHADLDTLPGIERAADALFATHGIGPLPPPADDATALSRSRAILVAGEPVVGFARLDEVDGAAHLEQLSVDPGHAGRGIGTALLAAAAEWATKQGYAALTLCTFADVPWNGLFYRRHGFGEFTDVGPGLRALRETENRLGLDALGRRTVMRRALNAPPTGTGARVVLNDLALRLGVTLEEQLLGLYAHGSWVAGDFAPARSDLDVLAILAEEPQEALRNRVETTHREIEQDHPAWRGRIEVEYAARHTIHALAADAQMPGHTMMRISPGERLHLLPATSHRLLTWASVRRIGERLVGPMPAELLPPIDETTVRLAALDHLRDWPQWVRQMEHPGGQVYSVLTLCRAWCLFTEGRQLSKRAAAARAAAALSEWQELILWARDWWYGDGEDDEPGRLPEAVTFVDDVSGRILGLARA